MEREQHKDFTWVDKALAASRASLGRTQGRLRKGLCRRRKRRPYGRACACGSWDGKNGKRSDISWSAEGNLSHRSVHVSGSHAVPTAG